jgi:hypothetical protein
MVFFYASVYALEASFSRVNQRVSTVRFSIITILRIFSRFFLPPINVSFHFFFALLCRSLALWSDTAAETDCGGGGGKAKEGGGRGAGVHASVFAQKPAFLVPVGVFFFCLFWCFLCPDDCCSTLLSWRVCVCVCLFAICLLCTCHLSFLCCIVCASEGVQTRCLMRWLVGGPYFLSLRPSHFILYPFLSLFAPPSVPVSRALPRGAAAVLTGYC